uniref:Uncharacterized protein n=1 Tax=Siphoviridae sp. ct43U4 TaxID=2826285 RepID=A0A8S5MZV8_9CAUD|nr:MAG TPA: hypothetical protein [Siphoviridae sp. ct43U4]
MSDRYGLPYKSLDFSPNSFYLLYNILYMEV